MTVLVNFTATPIDVDAVRGRVLLGTGDPQPGRTFGGTLAPDEGVIVQPNG
jgi:hypothetical protein